MSCLFPMRILLTSILLLCSRYIRPDLVQCIEYPLGSDTAFYIHMLLCQPGDHDF